MAKAPGPQANRRQEARLRQQQQAAAAKRRRLAIQAAIVGGVAVLALAIIGTAVFLGLRGQGDSVPRADTTVTVGGAQVPFAVTGSAVRLGPADAAARIDLWVDYSCPHCQDFEAQNGQLLDELVAAGKTSVSYHNIQVVSSYGTQAGSASACVATQDSGAWPAFNRALYANHSAATDGWNASQFRDFAAQQGVNAEAQSCISSGRYTGWIRENTAEAAGQQINSTPTMLINGERTEVLSGDALRARIDQLVQS